MWSSSSSASLTIMVLILSSAKTSALIPTQVHSHHIIKSKLSATASQSSEGASGQPWGGVNSKSRQVGVPSRTACESAVNVEWEPMTELDRRIEDGVNYEHLPSTANERQTSRKNRHSGSANAKNYDNEDDDIPSSRGVFVGYRVTDDEYNRLKSAHV